MASWEEVVSVIESGATGRAIAQYVCPAGLTTEVVTIEYEFHADNITAFRMTSSAGRKIDVAGSEDDVMSHPARKRMQVNGELSNHDWRIEI
jgi:hypothetical protein